MALMKIQEQNAAVSGNIDFTNVVTLRMMGEKYIHENPTPVFDFQQVTRANSAGLTLMLTWLRCAKQMHKTIRFINVPSSLKTMARVCDLTVILGMNCDG
jgi:phospholipid transport system transporter-binding protein